MATERAQSPPVGSPSKSTAENIKDTLESIVVAFILAFVFRAFIVEAFVIPTGSMAPTLYGNQVTDTCSTCGFEYARGIDQIEQERATSIQLHCPNCDTRTDILDRSQIASPDSGDRILVHKWPFDVGGSALGPHRWDVTVFKDPMDGTTNFIKRLVGLPGEVLEIIDGDVYIAKLEAIKKEKDFPVDELDRLRRDVYAYAHGGSGTRDELVNRYRELNKKLIPHLQIQRKLQQSTRAQQALWQNIYSHDFLPAYDSLPLPDETFSATGRNKVGWYPEDNGAGQAWNTSQREVTFTSNTGNPLFIRFEGKPINNFSAYNPDTHGMPTPVGDVRLRFTWFPDDGDGSILMRMNRDEAVFTAELKQDGTVTLSGRMPETSGPQKIDVGTRTLEPFTKGQAVEVEFMNVDYQVRLVINGRKVIDSVEAKAPYNPNIPRLLSKKRNGGYDVKDTEVRIGVRNLSGRLRHLVLERDAYYTNPDQSNEPQKINPYAGWPAWGTANMPIYLRPEHPGPDGKMRPGEYFMLGDNSPASKDSRLWWEIGKHLTRLGEEYQVGTVPGDQLIGKAFFVYWPAGYRPPWSGNIGLIPNVGRMRWIR